MRIFAWIIVVLSALAGIAELNGVQLPTLRWGFNVSREMGLLKIGEFLWFGWFLTFLALGAGIWMLAKIPKDFQFNPETRRRVQKFKGVTRGYVSLIILVVMALLAALDQTIVGQRALMVSYNGKTCFPAFDRENYKWADFVEDAEEPEAPVNFRKLKELAQENGGTVLMPLVPYDPTFDTIPVLSESLVLEDGVIYEHSGRKPYSGQAATVYDLEKPERLHMRFQIRNGMKNGVVNGFDASGSRVYAATYEKNELVAGSESWSGEEGGKDAFLKAEVSDLQKLHYPPAPPLPDQGHWLGTTSKGYDVLAYLYGGMQLNFKAAIFYIPAIYVIGISIGLLMGFFGGNFDIIVQRLIEVFSNIPFLFVVMIVSASVPNDYKGLGIIILILVVFGWMGMTNLMRTAALKEKARDYVAASRVIGCSTPRIIFKHILPNSVAILVTLIPFSISGLVMAITSLDYLGFGLPEEYASWGKLLKDGLNQLSKPWLASSAFFCLVSMLVLVTFVGEAIREAFDPKKHTYYK